MTTFILRRLAATVPVLAIIAVVVFAALRLAGADPVAFLAEEGGATQADRFLLRARAGFNDPLPMQFVHWLIGDDWYARDVTGDGVVDEYGKRQGILRGDLGVSLNYGRPVEDVIGQALPNTLLLGLTSLAVTVIASLGIGVFAATRRFTLADGAITGAAFITYSMPVFFIALMSVQIFAVQFKAWHDAGASWLPYLPVQGMYDVRGDRSPADLARHMILPVLCLSAIHVAGYSRYIRAALLEVLGADYVRTARAKGLSERRVIWLHAFKNAALPLVTLLALDLPFVLAGAVVTETIFAWPGMGRLYINSLEPLDPPVVMAFVLLIALAVVLAQLAADVAYAWLDPRIRYGT